MHTLKFNISTILIQPLLQILLPDQCIHCGTPLIDSELHLCSDCSIRLADEAFPIYTEEPVNMMSLMRYNNFSHNIIHSIKYRGNTTLAHTMGHILGQVLAESGHFDDIDLLLPIPLHPKKLRQRGYSQTLELCRGIVQTFPRPISQGDLVRSLYTRSQTLLSREDRIENLDGAFLIRRREPLIGKHILVVDDVLTTGSTISAVIQLLRALPGTHFSIATIALAR